ncbi:MAG TPA: hypothetical protein VMU34_26200 [Mycobacterium sp.]|nr:hypothetical protein [Mycobacterium sp.]
MGGVALRGDVMAGGTGSTATVYVCQTLPVPVLHIEHEIADLDTWLR